MNKHFKKIISLFLSAIIFFMASNFCWQGLIYSSFKTETAQAASQEVDNQNFDKDLDHCSDNYDFKFPGFEAMPMATAPANQAVTPNQTKHNNSFLPCCTDGSHSNPLVVAQSWQIEKNSPAIIINFDNFLKIIPGEVIYQAPLTSPPKLLAVSTINLRL